MHVSTHIMGIAGESPSVLTSCTDGNIELLRELLKSRHNPNESDSRGRTALHLAAARGRDDILSVLLSSGCDIAAVDIFGNTALHYCGHVETIQCLVDNGADIKARNQHGDDPLKLMRRRGVETEAIKLMEEFLSEQDLNFDDSKEPLLSKRGRRVQRLYMIKNLWHEFCVDLGTARLVMVLFVALCVSLYVAYVVTGLSKTTGGKIPVADPATKEI